MNSLYAIILAGGRGERLGSEEPKQFLDLAGMPVLAWSMEAFAAAGGLAGMVLVGPDGRLARMESIAAAHGRGLVRAVVPGGATRQGSSWNGLMALPFDGDDIVLIHDAARPFITPATILECVGAARVHGAAAVYVRATDTVAEGADGFVRAIPSRECLYYAQTPQCFRYALIRGAHERARAEGIDSSTDDVRLALDAGHRVRIVSGDAGNMKITTAFDLEAARFYAERGIGNDGRRDYRS
ncbi:MAG TPA: 2-C-methyl-D-erythritol 4-phosphate cytidylyltransferase [Spirochaetota bacterium]|nr:2-C-methyl-D-erythritol 4-phosphate cytidylyltransferase [Spirochaetota bacterium]